jgi:hypothetical protein
MTMRRTLLALVLACLASACTTLRPTVPPIEHWKVLPPAGYGDD